MKNSRNLLLALTLVILGTTAFSQSGQNTDNGYKFYFDDPMNRNTITFKSEAPLEDIIGTSNQISGYITFDPNKPTNSGFADLTVPVSSLNTGIPLRDEHLRSAGWLNAGVYPDINLKLDKVEKAVLLKENEKSKTFELTVSGQFTMHGITNKVEIPTRLTYLQKSEMTKTRLPGNLLAVRANFSIPLADYKVTGPEGMAIIGAKVGEEIKISVNLMGSTVSQSMAQEKM